MHLYISYNNSCGDLEGDRWRDLEFDRSADQRIAIAGVKVFTNGGSCNAPAVSWDAAHAMDLERDVGSIEVDKVADMVVMANDPLTQSGDELLDNRVLATLIDGKVGFCDGEWEDVCAELGPFGRGVGRAGDGVAAGGTDGGPSPADIVTIAAVRASSVDPAWPVEAVVDGVTDEGGWVSAGAAPEWIELDLSEEREVERVVLGVDQFPDGLTEHVIYGGLGPDPTTELARVEGTTNWGQRLDVEIGAIVRYLRIETVASPSTVAWLEISVASSEAEE